MTIPINMDLMMINTSDFGGWSSDPLRPDYAHPAYREMAPRWQVVHDIRGGTPNVRAKAMYYLPRFESEQVPDWDARIRMTFVNDWYAATLDEHVGLGMSDPIVFGDDVPPDLQEMMEDVDGGGNHIDVFSQTVLDQAMHFGHGVILTDYPVTDGMETLADARAAQVRPYASWYPAPHVLNWEETKVGGKKTLTHLSVRETGVDGDGVSCEYYRHFDQAVIRDLKTDRATSLGAITWTLWRKDPRMVGSVSDSGSPLGGANESFTIVGTGTIVGPPTIPARIVYGGQKLATLHSKPHLIGLAFSNLEETQVGSDYGNIMHKCNVPTPCFVGRMSATPGQDKVQMGQGLDLQPGGDAFFLEPSGSALGATRQRLEDIRTQMRRQGAVSIDASLGGRAMTATEAAIWAKQRNAKLRRAVRSLNDAEEGMLADFAAYENMAITRGGVESGGSLTISTNFAGNAIDPQYLNVLVTAYDKGAFPLEALLYALQNGKLPDDFNAQDEALRLMASAAAERQQAIDAQVQAQTQITNGSLPSDGTQPPVKTGRQPRRSAVPPVNLD